MGEPMTGETDLGRLIASMQPVLDAETYVFATVPDTAAARAVPSLMSFAEAEGLTLILTAAAADRHGLAGQFPCRRITLNVHSALEAVGFIAAVATRLAGLGMGVNPVSAFYHDHLFVPADRAGDAMEALHAMAREGGR